MTVFGHPGVGFRAGKMMMAAQQVFPVDYEAEVSQRLVEAVKRGDMRATKECLADPFVDVNYAGAVSLKGRRAVVVLHEETADEVKVEYEELRTDVSALFLAAHSGNLQLARKLLNAGADVNQRLFRGFALTAASREGQTDMVELLLKSGASQPACEEALLEACCHGRPRLVELLMGSDLIRHQVAVHALVLACCRGFVDVVNSLMKWGVDANATDRVLLRSAKPPLHTNVDCPPLIAAVVSRQTAVVRKLLEVRLGGWSWDAETGEELRVGAGLAEPYGVAWCAVEYFESSGAILRLLLRDHPAGGALHNGRALLHHAILCANPAAVDVLLESGAEPESPVWTSSRPAFRPIHMAARLGRPEILLRLVGAGCDLNSRTDSGDTALVLSAKHRQGECLRILAAAGADFGLVNSAGVSVASAAASDQWIAGLPAIGARRYPLGEDPLLQRPLGLLPLVVRVPDRRRPSPAGHSESARSQPRRARRRGPHRCHDRGERGPRRGLPLPGLRRCGREALQQLRPDGRHPLPAQQGEEGLLRGGDARVHPREGRRWWVLRLALRGAPGDYTAARLLTSRGYNVNLPDGDGYTPLMLAAREGHGLLCQLLISAGALCDVKTSRGETALSLARRHEGNGAEEVILDELSRVLVLGGAPVKKHTKCGRGLPTGRWWGKGSRRSVVCREATVGASPSFLRNRRGKADAAEPGIFRVVTTGGREIHFVCGAGGEEAARLWVRGIGLLSRVPAGEEGRVGRRK
ncbi:unnamed protein product [Spirodela intermedia]|uniref:Uncharacterized protein n=1 Tax=Spirodela intermedia TaxID=51605 RepID=A0A7I8ISF6_SPIIN|nr:unnamed protein product [Spirodela intermedia]CAA6660095.1 unnamed protein product [Spirodela intermedia]